MSAEKIPCCWNEIKTGNYRKLFHPNQLISGTEDAANNFARGFHTAGRIIKGLCEQRFRKAIELCGHLQAFHIYRSLGGGTGSGMTATIFEMLSEYTKTTKIEIPIHPSPHLSSAIVEPYNCILTEHFCMEDIDVSLLMDNEALYDILTNEISVKEPTFSHINRIVAQVCSSMTSSARFSTDLYNDFVVLTNLVPYPRIHYPLVSYAPFGNSMKLERDMNSVTEITKAVFNSNNQLVKCNPAYGKYMSCSLLYRGNVSPVDVYSALGDIKSFSTVNFVDWCPTGFKVGIVNQQPRIIEGCQIGATARNVVMLTNNSAVSTVWHRLSQKFHHLYSKRSFIHWFIGEGLEECEFCESLFNIATLAKDYEEVSLDTETSVSEDQTKSTTITKVKQQDLNIEPNIEAKLSKNSVDSEVSNPTFEKFIKISEENAKENDLSEQINYILDENVIEEENIKKQTSQEKTREEAPQEELEEEENQKEETPQEETQEKTQEEETPQEESEEENQQEETPQEETQEEETPQEEPEEEENLQEESSEEETPMDDSTDVTYTTNTNEETENNESEGEERNFVVEENNEKQVEEEENEEVNNYEVGENNEEIENDAEQDPEEVVDGETENEDAENENAENEDAENENAENEDAENENAENEDAENEDAENEDAENENAENENAENDDAENDDAENDDAENDDAENDDAENEDAENENYQDDDENNNNNNRVFQGKIRNSSSRKSGKRKQKSDDEIIRSLIRELSSKFIDSTNCEQNQFTEPTEMSLFKTNVFHQGNSSSIKKRLNSPRFQGEKDPKSKRSSEKTNEENLNNTDEKVIQSLMEELIRITAEISR